MTDNEIIKALEKYIKENKFEYFIAIQWTNIN